MPHVNPGNSLVVAERVLYELLGHRWVDPPIQVSEEYETNERRIHLRGRPVRSVESITVDGIEITGWRLLNTATIELPRKTNDLFWTTAGWIWTGLGRVDFDPITRKCGKTVLVDYTYGAEAPEMVKNAIHTLATEIDKAYSDDEDIREECRLPARVTEVSSRGISMTVLKPEDFVENGLTGLPEVDMAISLFNPAKARSRARVYSVTHPPGRRLQGSTP